MYIEFDEGQPIYFENQSLQDEVQEAQKTLIELDALQREYQ